MDYCDTCARLTSDINAKNATKNRLLQNSQSTPEDIQNIEEDIHLLEKNLQDHKTDAHKAYEYYKECIKRCQDQWENLVLLEESGDSEELECKKHTFTAVLSADYQMSKLIPHWGYSPQPGSTYYLQKLSNDIFGIVDHRRQQSMIYVTPEMYGPKNTEHTVSYLLHYLKNSGLVPDWVQRIHIFLDNAASTNKNFYSIAWAQELVHHSMMEFVRLSFMVSGHTKFDVDRLFSRSAQSFNKSDVFTVELAQVLHPQKYLIEDGSIVHVHAWRQKLEEKYTKLPGIRELHDFLVFKHATTGSVLVKVRKHCYDGMLSDSVMRVKKPEEDAKPDDLGDSYATLGTVKQLSSMKLTHLRQMYANFIPSDRRLSFI